ncbi:hypothetical protein [Streptosporangium sp. NPDC006930]|uniref:hypothetical protein n=1 Tax=unclassified Streptosporangium TaxID=2632669 RepID=UPI003442E717
MAWFAAHLLTEDRLPGWASGHRVVGVGSQTARPVDDVGAVTDAGGWLTVQAKKRLQLASAEDGALAEALRQLVDAVIDEVPSSPPNQHLLRSLDWNIDRVLLLGDEQAPVTVRDYLARVTDRLRTHPEAVPLEEAATNKPERDALGVLLAHLRRLWEERKGGPADDAALRRLLSPLVVRALNLRDDGLEYQTVQVMLNDMLVDQDQARDLWEALVAIGHELGESQRWIDRDSLVAELEERRFRLRPVTRLRRDIAHLRQTTRNNIAVLGSALTLTAPEGDLTLEREVGPILHAVEGSFALTGEPGTGKTALLCQLATYLVDQGNDVVLLSAEQLRASAGQTRLELNLEHDIKDILLGWPGTRPGRLMLDGLDQTRGENASQWLPTLAQQLAGSRWEIVATVRRFDLRNGRKWRAMFRGAPVASAHFDSSLQSVRHFLVEDLLPGELESLLQESPALADLLRAAGSRLQQLLSNPFNLDIASQLLADGALREHGSIRNRLDLLDQYWRVRVVEGGTNPWERASALTQVVAQMIADRRQQVAHLPDVDAAALQGLVSDGVLRDLPRAIGQPQPPIAFGHPVLFDFAASMLALGETSHAESLAEELDAEPNLALLLRPSMEYRLAIAWRNDPTRHEFWRLALRLNAETSGHHLAAAAAATVCSRELLSPDDLASLAEACLRRTPAVGARENSSSNACRMAFLIAAAIANSDLQPSPFGAFSPFVEDLARAARATDDVSLALDAAQLLRRAAGSGISLPNIEARDNWVQVVVDCMAVALEDVNDPARARIGKMLSWPLARAIPLDGTACEPIARVVLSHEVLRAWGFEMARVLIQCLPDIAKRNAEIAVEIAAAPWEYEEDRQQVTSFTDSRILGLTSNLQQDLNHLRWSVCENLPKIASADLEAAVRLLIRIAEVPRMFQYDRSTDTGRRPRIRYGDTLRYAGGHSELEKAVDAVIVEIQAKAEHVSSGLTNAEQNGSADQQELRQIVQLLISTLSHGEVWQRLLMQAANAESPALAHLLVPTLEAGIFERGQTRGAAGLVAARLSPELDIAIHRRIEAAILSATSPEAGEVDDPRRQEWQRRQRDALLGPLDRRKISEPEALQHLEELASGDRDDQRLHRGREDSDPADDSLFWMAEEPQDDNADDGGVSGGSSADVAEALQRASDHDLDIRRMGYEKLAESWAALRRQLQTDASQTATEEDRFLLVQGARQLAHSVLARPGQPLGCDVLAVLQAALPSAASPPQHDEVEPGWRVWSATITVEAVEGITTLAGRPEWLAEHQNELSEAVTPFLNSPNALYRMLSAEAIPFLFEERAALEDLEARLCSEMDSQVQAILISLLSGYRHDLPLEVDEILRRIATKPQWEILATGSTGDAKLSDEGYAGLVVNLLVIMATQYGTPYAHGTLQAWLSSPLENPRRAERVPSWLRRFLNTEDTNSSVSQQRAFALLKLPLPAVGEAWADENAAVTPNTERATNAAKVADGVVQNIYFASGATNGDKTQGERATSIQKAFAEHAFPLLEGYSLVRHPKVTHHIIQTLDHISIHAPERALLGAVRAAGGDANYAREPLALSAVLQLIQRYFADHRELIVSSPKCMTAVRTLLETFVRQGWDEAIQFAERLEDMFR